MTIALICYTSQMLFTQGPNCTCQVTNASKKLSLKKLLACGFLLGKPGNISDFLVLKKLWKQIYKHGKSIPISIVNIHVKINMSKIYIFIGYIDICKYLLKTCQLKKKLQYSQ